MKITIESKLINRLLYLNRELNMVIENTITEYALRGKGVNPEELKEHLVYRIDDAVLALKQGR